MGLFFDDPRTTDAAKCRFLVGWVFKQGADIAKPEGAQSCPHTQARIDAHTHIHTHAHTHTYASVKRGSCNEG